MFPKLKQNPWKVPVRDFSKELFSKCEGVPPNMNCFKGFAKTISFLFYIFEIYVRLFLRNTLLQILLIESIFFNHWIIVTTSGTTSDNEWQRVTTNGNKWQWQQVVKLMKSVQYTHQRIDDCHFFLWLLQVIDGCN